MNVSRINRQLRNETINVLTTAATRRRLRCALAIAFAMGTLHGEPMHWVNGPSVRG
jgi:hypothetical protein